MGERLREERIRLGYSQEKFAALGGASKGSQLAWEKNCTTPNAAFLNIISRAGADVLYVITGQRIEAILSVEEVAVLDGYRQLDRVGRNGVLALIGGMQPHAHGHVK